MTHKALIGQLEKVVTELNRRTTVDKDFPLVMRVRGLVDNYMALAELYEQQKAQLDAFLQK